MGGSPQQIADAAKDVGSSVNTGAKNYLFGPGQGGQSWHDLAKYGADPEASSQASPVDNYLFGQQQAAEVNARRQRKQNDYQQLQGS